MRIRTPRLDFIVIGAQKAGTTSLWRYLEDNPALRMPPDKEGSFFTEPLWPSDLRAYMRAIFKNAPRGAKLGKVSPAYMLGVPGVPVGEVARRIRMSFPDIRLAALLRDPVPRALSGHRFAVRVGVENRPFEQAIEELLAPAELQRSRDDPADPRSYVVAGEYGRILGEYLAWFPREQIHLELSDDLERSPLDVVERVCRFVGAEPHRPRHLGTRFHPTGPVRVSPEAETDLKEYLDRHVWPRVRHPEQHREHFRQWFMFWNAVPEPAANPVDDAIAARLREHYASDERLLEELTGLRPGWVAPRSAAERR